jgi:hypothetical protein
MRNIVWTIAAIVAVTGAFAILPALMNGPAYAEIREVTRCDGDEGDCPGKSEDSQGPGHEETTQNENPSGKAPPGQNK